MLLAGLLWDEVLAQARCSESQREHSGPSLVQAGMQLFQGKKNCKRFSVAAYLLLAEKAH